MKHIEGNASNSTNKRQFKKLIDINKKYNLLMVVSSKYREDDTTQYKHTQENYDKRQTLHAYTQ